MNLDPVVLANIAADREVVRAALGDDEDAQAFLDTLEGLNDWKDILTALAESEQDDEDAMDRIDARVGVLKARKERIETARGRKRQAMLAVLQAMDVKSVNVGIATLTRKPGSKSVEVYDESDLPSQLWAVTTTKRPDKAAIRVRLDAGENIPGARVTTGPERIEVRTK